MRSTIDHEADFYAWTQDQAALLRVIRPKGVDWEHLAEEIEDLGKGEFRFVKRQLRDLLAHMLLAACSTDENLIWYCKSKMVVFQIDAIDAYDKSMHYPIEIEMPKIWRWAQKQAAPHLPKPSPTFPAECPLSLTELLDEDLDVNQAISRMLIGENSKGDSPGRQEKC